MGTERIKTGKRVGAAVVHIPSFANERLSVDKCYPSRCSDRVVQVAGKKEYRHDQSMAPVDRVQGPHAQREGRRIHLSPKLRPEF